MRRRRVIEPGRKTRSREKRSGDKEKARMMINFGIGGDTAKQNCYLFSFVKKINKCA